MSGPKVRRSSGSNYLVIKSFSSFSKLGFWWFVYDMVARWFAPSPHSKKAWGLNLGSGLSVWSVHVLPVRVWVSSGPSSFPPQSKDMLVRRTDRSKLSIGVCEWEWISVCLWALALRQAGDLFRVYAASRPLIAGIGSSRPETPKVEEKWMDV